MRYRLTLRDVRVLAAWVGSPRWFWRDSRVRSQTPASTEGGAGEVKRDLPGEGCSGRGRKSQPKDQARILSPLIMPRRCIRGRDAVRVGRHCFLPSGLKEAAASEPPWGRAGGGGQPDAGETEIVVMVPEPTLNTAKRWIPSV